MYYLVGIFLGILILTIITRPFTTLFHELGHAIPAMLLTKQGASVFVGSYGNPKQCIRIKIRRLEIWIRYNPIGWGGGVCIPKAKKVSFNKRMIYILCGPLFSTFIAVLLCYLVFSFDLHGSLKLICVFALGSTVIDLFVNLFPRIIRRDNGEIVYTDGYLLLNLKRLEKFPDEYADAVELYNEKKYEKTAKLFDRFIARGLVNEDIYRFAATSFMFIKQYEKAYALQKEFESKYQPGSIDYYNLGFTCSVLNLKEDMTLYFQKSLALDPNNSYSLNAIGYELNTKNRYHEALSYFDRAIKAQPDFAYAYNNRGHAKIETGKLAEGLNDIMYSLGLDKENAYVYRNLGIYHLIKNEKDEALKYFVKSKQMDKDTELIEDLINKASILV